MGFCPPICGNPWLRRRGGARLVHGPLPEVGPVCRDPNDDHVIATAVAVNAEIIVTGDKDLLALSQYQSIRILTAAAS